MSVLTKKKNHVICDYVSKINKEDTFQRKIIIKCYM